MLQNISWKHWGMVEIKCDCRPKKCDPVVSLARAQGIPIYHPPVVKVASHKPLLTKAMKNRKAAPVEVSLAEILWWCYLRSLDTFDHLKRNFHEKNAFERLEKLGPRLESAQLLSWAYSNYERIFLSSQRRISREIFCK